MRWNKENKQKIKSLLKDYNLIKSQIISIEIDLKYEENKKSIKKLKEVKAYKEELLLSIDNAFKCMNEIEQQVLKLRYLSGRTKTWKEIGVLLKRSPDYLRQAVFNKCLIKICNNLNVEIYI